MSESKENKESGGDGKKRRGHFWLIVGAGILLTIVYQSGKSSGIRSIQESQPEKPVPLVAVPDHPPESVRPTRPAVPANAQRNQQAVQHLAPQVGLGQPIPGGYSQRVIATPNYPPGYDNQESLGLAVPVQPGMVQPQRVISTPDYPLDPGSMVYPPGPPGVPSNYYPAMHESVPNDPFPIRPSRASDLMSSPLSPLQPLSEPATVYPVPQPAERTTFKEPILAPVLPSAQPTSASRLVSPIRITSAAECDCGVDH